jgi:NADH-quinone oxidoreductase subunit A
LTSSNAYSEKTIAYECGFEPFSDARDKFSVNFYVTAIIFLIFDIELAYLIPLAISYGYVGVAIVPSALIFISLLALGYVFEIVKH